MGDNRQNSADSRGCFSHTCSGTRSPFIEREYILGRVWINFGYFEMFNRMIPGSFHWVSKPRLTAHPKSWEYPELEQ